MHVSLRSVLALGLPVVFAALAAGCAQSLDTSALDAEHAQLAANKAAFQRFFDEVAMGGNLALIDELCSVNFVEHEEMPGMTPGRAGVHEFFSMIRAAFPDLHVTVDHMLAEGDKVVAAVRWSGTHQGEFMGVPASGNQVSFTSWEMVRMVDGRAVEHWGLTDGMAMMMGMGAIPMPAGTMP
jgi:predicted ester cyclase